MRLLHQCDFTPQLQPEPHDRGPLAHLGLVLLHDTAGDGHHGGGAAEPAQTTSDARGRYAMPGIPEESSRLVAPGVPDRSALLYRMRSRRPSSQMPPLGTAIPDEDAAQLVRRWIESVKSK